ncbi:hypothetical protein IFM89_021204, partial [Coptis chinensis]
MVLFVSIAMLRNMSEGANWTGKKAENLVLERGENKEVLKISDERNLSCNFCKLKIGIIVPLPFGKPRTSLGEVKKSIEDMWCKFVKGCLCWLFLVNVINCSGDSVNGKAVVLAYGVESDWVVGVPGEDLEGIYSAREFVWWTQAVVQLYDYRKVYLVGRRGPVQAACLQKNCERFLYYSSRSLYEIETGNFTFIKSIPPCRNVLADVFPIPWDVFGLEDLIGVLSYE